MTRAGRKTDAATTLLMVLLILTAAKLLLERLLALMLPHDLHQNTRLLLSMAQEALLIGLQALLMRRGRSARTGTMRLSIGLLLCAAVLGLAMRALATPLTQLWGNFLSAPDSQIAAADSAGKWCLQLLALAVLPAVLEEALFRGVVLQTLLDSGSRFGAWLLTTLFFSLLHGNLAALPAHLLFGGALTLAEMRTGNLLVPMVMHAVYNASALFWRGMSSGWLIFCGGAGAGNLGADDLAAHGKNADEARSHHAVGGDSAADGGAVSAVMIRRDFASAEAIPPATSIILYIRKNYRHKANPPRAHQRE